MVPSCTFPTLSAAMCTIYIYIYTVTQLQTAKTPFWGYPLIHPIVIHPPLHPSDPERLFFWGACCLNSSAFPLPMGKRPWVGLHLSNKQTQCSGTAAQQVVKCPQTRETKWSLAFTLPFARTTQQVASEHFTVAARTPSPGKARKSDRLQNLLCTNLGIWMELVPVPFLHYISKFHVHVFYGPAECCWNCTPNKPKCFLVR